jgi:glycosyltransferase involved in cell wall biosynthesis
MLESMHCRGNQFLWKAILDQYHVHQVICGYALTALPHALSDKPFVAWIASSMEGDKRARVTHGGPIRRTLYRAQAKELGRLEQLVLERAAWIFALSPHTQSELLQRGANATRISVLPCPVDVRRFSPAPKPPKRPTVICIGRHSDPRKNTTCLMRAFARIVNTVPDARLVLVGSGDPVYFRRFADELGISNHFEFAGEVSDDEMADFYRGASVLAIPSDQEGLGIVGLEAMACAIPVVSTRCGGPEAFVIPGKTGLLVDVGNHAQMADAIHYLLTDHSARETMGSLARDLVTKRYSVEGFSRHVRQVHSTIWPELFDHARGAWTAAI